jgi:hypothetical protein
MDVMLDSNGYLSDLRMESIAFKNLFDYLRRTKCSLVLPRLVREETVAKYRHLLDQQAKRVAQAVKDLNRLIVNKKSEIHFAPPKSVHAARELRDKFREVEKAGLIRYYPDVSGVDVNEVFLRGVKRRRPANKEGEELRDVIIWLIALQYAEKEKKQIALVSNDGGFWNDTQIHEHLKQDIDERKVDILLFRNVDDFIKSSAPEPKSVDEAYVSKVFAIEKLAEEITATAKKALSTWKRFFQPLTMRSVKLESAKFSSGTVYEIDSDTKFVELAYEVFIVADLAFTEQPFAGGGFGSVFQRHRGTLAEMAAPLTSFADPSAPLMGHDVFRMYRPGLGLGMGGSRFEPPQPQRTTVKTYAVSANAQVFLRLVKGEPSEVELNRVEITKAEETAEAEEIPPAVE